MIVGEDHDWGDLLARGPGRRAHRARAGRALPARRPGRAARVHPAAAPRTPPPPRSACDAELLVSYVREHDDGPPWDFPAQREATGLPAVLVDASRYGERPTTARRAARRGGCRDDPAGPAPPRPPPTSASGSPSCARGWRAGDPLALVNADAPQEMFRAMGIPYVVNQWWASIVAAKRRTQRPPRPAARARLPRLHRAVQRHVAGVGVRPRPGERAVGRAAHAERSCSAETTGDASRKVFDVWDAQPGVTFYPLESAVDGRPCRERWWELVAATAGRRRSAPTGST